MRCSQGKCIIVCVPEAVQRRSTIGENNSLLKRRKAKQRWRLMHEEKRIESEFGFGKPMMGNQWWNGGVAVGRDVVVQLSCTLTPPLPAAGFSFACVQRVVVVSFLRVSLLSPSNFGTNGWTRMHGRQNVCGRHHHHRQIGRRTAHR